MTASITLNGVDVEFSASATEEAVARNEVTQASVNTATTYRFEVRRRTLTLRVGTSAGAQDIVTDNPFAPGIHYVTFTPGVSPYYIEFRLSQEGEAVLAGFEQVDAAGDLSIEAPWTESELASLRHEQSLNTEWWVMGDKIPRALERRGATSWSLRLFQPANGPFSADNLSDIEMTAAARTGTTTITANRPVFVEGDAGALIRLTHAGQYESETFTSVDEVSDPIRVTGVEGERIFYYTVSVSGTGTVVLERSVGNKLNWVTHQTFSSTTSGSVDDDLDNQVIFYRFRCTATTGSVAVTLTYGGGVSDGIGRIHTVDADNEVTVDVLDEFAKTTATTIWALGAWSGRFGYPEATALHDGRLYTARRNAYWASAPDNYEDFEIGPEDGNALGRTFPGRMSSVRWLGAGKVLMAGLSGQEALITSNAFQELIVPSNVRSTIETNRGSANTSQVLVDGGAVFVSRSLERLLMFYYDSGLGGHVTQDLTRLNRDVCGAGGFREIAYQSEPEPRLWCVRNDGQIGVLSFDPGEKVFAWWRVVMDGAVESVCCVPGTPEDDVYFIVRRTVGGSLKRFVEKLAPEDWDASGGSAASAWRLHCALEYSGAETSTLTGLDHLEGREDIYVWGDGAQQGPFTVSSGSITLDSPVSYAIAGLKYSGRYRSPRMTWGGQMGTPLTRDKKIGGLGIVTENTPGGCLAWGRSFNEDEMDRLEDVQQDDLYDGEISLWTADLKNRAFEGETDTDPRIHILMDKAGPAKVQALVPLVKTNE
ncbi:hypothetical protein [Henriciella pelagia]|uniref:hypothetical protein n=1 Tax=Henriciella pelagia TaxID=1977912 RepID=UPI00351379A3